ncbi:MAG: hypothetical protein A2583_02840 [Bdellovibrionales bacterium RIFOXYD1_FULL_53_11]|nr:MAG: hypothetical protein A2583_02840 [Bdellovibrionales bacterium RIFOXYD1_FULL_53_11]
MYCPADQSDLGVLGGMGPRATHYFVEELLRAVEELCQPMRDQDYPNVFVRYACYLPDRTSAIETDLRPLARALRKEVQILKKLGCRRVVIPCVSAHVALERHLSGCPVVNILEAVATYLHLNRPGSSVGVLATRGSRLSGIVEKFTSGDQKVAVLSPDKEDQLMAFIYQRAKTAQSHGDASELVSLANSLRDQGCDLIIAGCTEVEMCLARLNRLEMEFVFPLQIVAKAIVLDWQGDLPGVPRFK